MKDPMLRSEIVGVVRSAMSEVMEQMEERWVTPAELSKQFAFFSKEWMRHYAHMLPRERVEVVGDGENVSTHWAYPIHKINRMVAEGKFRMLEYKEAMKTGKVGNRQPGEEAEERGEEHGGEPARQKNRGSGDALGKHGGETTMHKQVVDGEAMEGHVGNSSMNEGRME